MTDNNNDEPWEEPITYQDILAALTKTLTATYHPPPPTLVSHHEWERIKAGHLAGDHTLCIKYGSQAPECRP